MTEVYNKLNSGSFKKDVHTQIPRTCECEFIWKKSLCWCNKVKDLEINSFWITQVGPKSKDKCPFRRKKRRAHRQTEEAATSQPRQRQEPRGQKPRERLEPPEAGRGKEKNLPESLLREHSPDTALIPDL